MRGGFEYLLSAELQPLTVPKQLPGSGRSGYQGPTRVAWEFAGRYLQILSAQTGITIAIRDHDEARRNTRDRGAC